MYTLYLLRHGQTLYNLQRLVQGRCDSPLTSTGIQQAKAAGAWLAAQDVVLSAIHSSPLKRAMDTAYAVRDCLHRDARHQVPLIQECPGIIERSYGSLEEGSVDDVPLSVWDPLEEVVPYGGEGSIELRTRMVGALTQVMRDAVAAAEAKGERVQRARRIAWLRDPAVQAGVGASCPVRSRSAVRQLLHPHVRVRSALRDVQQHCNCEPAAVSSRSEGLAGRIPRIVRCGVGSKA